MHYFFKPVFYRKDTDEVLFIYDIMEEMIEIRRLTVDKEFKTTKDCFKKLKEESEFLDEVKSLLIFGSTSTLRD